jgi:hypothetical protein
MVDTQPMSKPALFFLALAFSLLPARAVASPKDDLVGYWKLRRGLGGPCGSQIETLTYYFGRDGKYRAEARMISGGEFKAVGTYSATDYSATARVEGAVVGPYPYSIQNNVLTVDHPQFGCKILLDREDY